MEDKIKEIFEKHKINFDSGNADYVDDSFELIKQAIIEIVEQSKQD